MDGERLIPCVGHRVAWRRVDHPPPFEIEVEGGLLVLDDTDPSDLHYVFVPTIAV